MSYLMMDFSQSKEHVLKAQAGDEESFSLLYQSYYRITLNYAYRHLSNWEDAEDLVQEVFMVVRAHITRLRAPEAFASWLKKIVRTRALNKLTRKRVYNADPVLCMNLAYEQICELEVFETQEKNRLEIKACMDRLPKDDRLLFENFYRKGQSIKEIAANLGKPTGTVKRRLFTARERFRNIYEPAAS